MKCDANCEWGDDASIHFSYIEDGKIRKVNLCKNCAAEKKVTDPTGYSLVDLLQGMGEETSTSKKTLKPNELSCPFCGFTQSDFKKTGRFGCAECYEIFSEGLESLLEAMHKKTVHIGKTPSLYHLTRTEAVVSELSPAIETPSLPSLLEEERCEIGLALFDEMVKTTGPEAAPPDPELRLAQLRDQLELAISAEDYEEAARIRDEIVRLEGKKN